MVGTSSSSSSSCASFGSVEEASIKSTNTIKFLCNYGGKILPRYPDGKLRYVGGVIRVLAVDRSITYSELQVKLRELSGWSDVSVRCQLPTEDLDALVSVTSDEDLANLIEEYDLASASASDRLLPPKIKAFILLSSSSKSSPKSPTTTTTTTTTSSPSTPISHGGHPLVSSTTECRIHQMPMPVATRFLSSQDEKPASAAAIAAGVAHSHGRLYRHHGHHHYGHQVTPHNFLGHHGNHWPKRCH